MFGVGSGYIPWSLLYFLQTSALWMIRTDLWSLLQHEQMLLSIALYHFFTIPGCAITLAETFMWPPDCPKSKKRLCLFLKQREMYSSADTVSLWNFLNCMHAGIAFLNNSRENHLQKLLVSDNNISVSKVRLVELSNVLILNLEIQGNMRSWELGSAKGCCRTVQTSCYPAAME